MFLAFLGSCAIATAQDILQTGTMKGIVSNAATLEPLLGANVVVMGTNRGASTDVRGAFSIPQIAIGTYVLRVSAIGFETTMKSDVVVSVAKPVEVIVRLLESGVEMAEVEVRGSYFQKLPEAPVSNFTQSSEEIRRLPGGLEDVVRAISILPGVAQVQPGRNDLIVRGGAPSENLFVVDNLEVNNINHFGTQGASGGPLSYVNLDFVDNTSFSAGGFGVKYGDKLSSVLSINLREGRKDRLGGKATISASQFGLNLEGPVRETGSWIVSARRSFLDFIFKAAGFSFVPEYWDLFAKGDYKLSSRDQLEVLAIGALDNIKLFNETGEKRFDNSRILASDQNQFVGGATWKHLTGESFSTVTLGQTYVDYHFAQIDTTLAKIFSDDSRETETSLKAEMLFHPAKSTEVTLGVQVKNVGFESKLFLAPFWTNFGQQIAVNAQYATQATKGGLFAQVSQRIDRARITAGLRADYFDLIKDKMAVAPRLNATVPLSEKLNLNGSIGRYYQSPSLIWLVSHPSNRSLAFISVDQFVVGVDYSLREDARVTLEAYRKNYTNYPASLVRTFLVQANTGAGYGGSDDGFASFGIDPLISSGGGFAQGLEFLIQKKLSSIPCYGTVSVSYNRTEFAALDGVSRPGTFDQTWIINLGGGYVVSERWEFSAKFRYATGRPYTPYFYDSNLWMYVQRAQDYNAARIEANHSLDVRADRRWNFGAWNLVTYLDLQNVYNRKPIDIPRFNQRTGQFEQTDAIGLLPSIGITAEF